MKTKFAFILLLFSIFASSQKFEPLQMAEGTILIDSVKVEDSIKIKNLTVRYKDSRIVFGGIKDSVKAYLNSFYYYDRTKKYLYDRSDILQKINDEKKFFYNRFSDTTVDKPVTYFRHLNMKVLSQPKHFIIFKTVIQQYDGGAPSYEEHYRILDKFFMKPVIISNIIDTKKENELAVIIAKNGREQNEYFAGKTSVPVSENFYFDESNLYFVYQTYEIASYDAGLVEIKVPISEIESFLSPSFKKRLAEE